MLEQFSVGNNNFRISTYLWLDSLTKIIYSCQKSHCSKYILLLYVNCICMPKNNCEKWNIPKSNNVASKLAKVSRDGQ